MKWVPDSTGRFPVRPQYGRSELDAECERGVNGFLHAKYGNASFPISTDDLTVMLEQVTSDVDLYADLTYLGEDVEGVTEFSPGKRPSVRISQKLSLDANSRGRLRTTLAHECAHARLHAFLWTLQFDMSETGFWSKLSKQHNRYQKLRARFGRPLEMRDVALARAGGGLLIDSAGRTNEAAVSAAQDWMESQADYASMASLMPVSALKRFLRDVLPDIEESSLGQIPGTHPQLAADIATAFDVPAGIVQARLANLGVATSHDPL